LALRCASSTALLLNLESLATMVVAWLIFRENVDRGLLIGAAAIPGGAVSPGAQIHFVPQGRAQIGRTLSEGATARAEPDLGAGQAPSRLALGAHYLLALGVGQGAIKASGTDIVGRRRWIETQIYVASTMLERRVVSMRIR
jgi:hypothetical protein